MPKSELVDERVRPSIIPPSPAPGGLTRAGALDQAQPRAPALLVFTRPPLPGRAKTRLIPALGPVGAARVHALLLRRTVRVAAQVPGCEPTLWTATDTGHPLFAALSARYGVRRRPQAGGDLGRRMQRALTACLARAPAAVLIGSDCPGLTRADIEQAFVWLAGGADAVLGPASDGGYWLIGLRRPSVALFRGVDWGTGRVAAQTRSRLRRLGLSWRELPVRSDLDRPRDLLRSGIEPWRGAFSGLRSVIEQSPTGVA